MRFRSQSSADLALRTLFFVGIAMAIGGVVVLQQHKAIGVVLLAVGVSVAVVGPYSVSGPETAGGRSDVRTPDSGSGRG